MLWQAGSGFSGIAYLLPIALIAMVIFTTIPQQRRKKQWDEMLTKLKPGDRVTTSGGIRGTILSVKDDTLLLRLPPDNIKLEFSKSAIASLTTEEAAEK